MVETGRGWRSASVGSARLDAARRTCDHQDLQITFKKSKFNSMNISDMIPAAGRAAELMRSLSHPQRLLVLCALGREEKTVAQLREELGVAQVPMSQQLMRLRADGLVEARREGTAQVYRIPQPEVLTVVEALHAAFCPPSNV